MDEKKNQLEELLRGKGYPHENTVFEDLKRLLSQEKTWQGSMKVLIDYLLRKKKELGVDNGFTNKEEVFAIFGILCRELGEGNDFKEEKVKPKKREDGRTEWVSVTVDTREDPYKNAKKEIAAELKRKGMEFLKKDRHDFSYPAMAHKDIVAEIKVAKTRERKKWQDELMAHSKDLFISPQWTMRGKNNKERTIIDFGSNTGLRNAVNLPILYEAILKEQVLEIEYEKLPGEKTSLEFHPYFLRQYNNRWFVVGYAKYSKSKAFHDDVKALDRITDIKEKEGVKYRTSQEDYTKYFEDIIGVTFEKKSRTKVNIEFITHDEYIHQLLLTLPLHSSQKEMEVFDKEKREGRFMLEGIIPNRELRSRLLYYGDKITVVEPSWYYGSMWETAEKMLRNYRKYSKKQDETGGNGV